MKIKFAILTALFCFIASPALAVDPECENVTQADSLDFSDGTGAICLPAKDGAGQDLADSKVLTCSVTFKDGTGAVIVSAEFVGGPGKFIPFDAPRDGIGTASASCTMDELVSESVSVIAVFPSATAPAQPVILP